MSGLTRVSSDNMTTCKGEKMLFAFFFFEGQGHINPAVSMARELRRRGHETVLLSINDIGPTDERIVCLSELRKQREREGQMKKPQESQTIGKVDERMANHMQHVSYGTSKFESLVNVMKNMTHYTDFLSDPVWDQLLKEVIDDLRPNVIVVDHPFCIPAIMKPSYKQKWVKINSPNALFVYSRRQPDRFPAPFLGVSVNVGEADRKLSWEQFHTGMKPVWPLAKHLADSAQLELQDLSFMMPDSPYLNIYIFPRELDYDQELGHPLDGWVRIQSVNRPKKQIERLHDNCDNLTTKSLLESLDLPQDLRHFIERSRNNSKKLVFLSLGTIASIDVEMMKRLVKLLAETPYQVIVSKGPKHNDYSLASNMWGTRHVPQKEILLLADLVITHGGNNTITECLYSGVPSIIVCPMFCDQYDNAVRMEEKHLAASVDLGQPESDQLLLDIIRRVLEDNVMKDNIRRVSREMRLPSEGPEKAAELIEKLALVD